MDKFRNLFWHEGAKAYNEKELDRKAKEKIRALENDVTKALLNIIEYCPHARKELLVCLAGKNIKPEGVQVDFQITDKEKFKNRAEKIMLRLDSMLSEETKPDDSERDSRPDGAIYGDGWAVLIEAKTQSKFDEDQFRRHKRNYMGVDAQKERITWEEVYEVLNGLEGLPEREAFLIEHFCSYLELLDLNPPRFREEDLKVFPREGTRDSEKHNEEELEKISSIQRNLLKLHGYLKEEMGKLSLQFKKGKIPQNATVVWFGWFDSLDKKKTEELANLNFTIQKEGLFIEINAETKPVSERVFKKIESQPQKFDELLGKIGKNAYLWQRVAMRPTNTNDFEWMPLSLGPNLFSSIPEGLSSAKEILDLKDKANEFFSKSDRGLVWAPIAKHLERVKRSGVEFAEKWVKGNLRQASLVLRIRTSISAKEMDQMDHIQLRDRVKGELKKLEPLLRFLNEPPRPKGLGIP